MKNILSKIKPIYILIAFLILCASLITYYIYQTIDRSNKLQITINLVPSDSRITLNNKPYSNGINYVLPKEYKVIVEKSGFKTVATTVNIDANGDQINISLAAQSDEAKKWAANNTNMYKTFENIVNQEANKNGEELSAKNPIIKKLPFKNYLYSIGYKLDSSDKTGNSIIITINSSEQYRQSAISQIERWGFNIADFNIEFNDFTNPFKI